MRSFIALCLVGALDAALTAQVPPKAPAFEVASVKPTAGLRAGGVRTGHRYREPGTTLRRLIEFAYDLPRIRVVDGPGWADTEHWAIEAVSLEPATIGQMRLLVQTLLRERFRLHTRTETRELSVHDLHVARLNAMPAPGAVPSTSECTHIGNRSPESLLEAKETPCGPPSSFFVALDGSTTLRYQRVTMATLARSLENYLQGLVRDRTGLAGEYDISLAFAAGRSSAVSWDGRASPPPLFSPLPEALERQLGLSLVSTTGPVDVLVIAQVERPTPD